MKDEIYEFDPIIYPYKIWITVTKKNKLKYFKPLSKIDSGTTACVDITYNYENKEVGSIIRFTDLKYLKPEIMAHEAVHAAFDIFDFIGANIDYQDQETFSYLVGWITNCCEQVKLKFK